MADKNPWFKFYPSDWRGDQTLRLCSAAARGLWVECMCLMHEAKPYGHLLVNGRRVTDAQLANLTGIPQDQLTELFGELDNAGVFSRNSEGTIYSRRMTRDAKRAADGARYGRKGGNPALTLNPTLNPDPNPQDHPEARIQSLDKPKKEDVQKLVLSSIQTPQTKKAWTREQIKAAWQTKICNEAARTMPPEKYAAFLAGWTADEKWARDIAEQLDRNLKASAHKRGDSPQGRDVTMAG